MGKPLISLFLLATTAAWTPDAAACKIKPYPDQFPTGSTAGGSSQPPPTPSLVDARVTRSQHAPPGNGDCAEVGRLHLQFGIVGSPSWPADLGVRLTLARGSLPPAFEIPAYALVAPEGTLDFSGGDDPSQPMDFTLQASAVDSAGNESSPIEVHVTDSGKSGGCSFAGKPSRGGTLWSAFCGVLLGWSLFRTLRRRRA
jgi:hypothetical protein